MQHRGRPRLLMQLLGWAGLLPFVLAAAAIWLAQGYPQALAQHAFVLYSLAILAFLGGTLWGRLLPVLAADGEDGGPPLPADAWLRALISNGVVLYAFVAVLTSQTFIAAGFLALGYLTVLWYELGSSDMAPWYRRMRTRLTLLVVLLHGVYMVGLSVLRP